MAISTTAQTCAECHQQRQSQGDAAQRHRAQEKHQRRKARHQTALKSLAASAAVLVPLETIFRISDCCYGDSFGRRPPIRPSSRAASNPALVRSFSMDFSNSAKAPAICIIIRPAGVVVSIASVKPRNPAPASPSRSMMVSTSRRERESRSSFHTTSTSPFRS